MSASGRVCEITNGRFVEAKQKEKKSEGPPSGCFGATRRAGFGSGADDRPIGFIAGMPALQA